MHEDGRPSSLEFREDEAVRVKLVQRVVNLDETVLTAVSLYALTDSVVSAGWIYAANPTGFKSVYAYPGPGTDDAPPMVFSHFAYNVGLWPEEWVSKVGNLVDYRVHAAGGHFAGLDNPVGLVEDIRELGNYVQALN
ncbi:hypothetical protein C8F01DRAFT_1264903 [Mycena amicta]|nr:hypothetical protein C8F01DRAFT_1264903 [Mycena amicta]